MLKFSASFWRQLGLSTHQMFNSVTDCINRTEENKDRNEDVTILKQ